MKQRSLKSFAALSVLICLGTAGCSAGSDSADASGGAAGSVGSAGSAGSGGAAGGTTNTDSSPDAGWPTQPAPAADELASLLVGQFAGQLETSTYEWELRADHTATLKTFEAEQLASSHDCEWSVSGADKLPDFDGRWLVTVSASDNSMTPETHEIVHVEASQFVIFRNVEGTNTYREMLRTK
ncbi:MAG: hypothetical protein IPI67_36395 [Myxococcales bacterium]|nr:hypothetical protein [Myxococcales bacterium]